MKWGRILVAGIGTCVAVLLVITLVVCADCGLTRFFAGTEPRARLADSKDWARVQ